MTYVVHCTVGASQIPIGCVASRYADMEGALQVMILRAPDRATALWIRSPVGRVVAYVDLLADIRAVVDCDGEA